jgi:hypothetical protein
VAATLAANGYRPLPIKPGGKYPGFDDWQHFAYAPGCERQYPQHGAGVLLGDVVALDIDVDDADAAAAIEEAVRAILHIGDVAQIPRRTGRSPRVLIPFRTPVPFAKIKSASYTLQSNGHEAHVEVLAEGQQFCAYHVHPDTQRPYTWNGGGDLLTVPRDALPEITEAQARAIVRAAETILSEWGDRVGVDEHVHHEHDERKPFAEGGRNDALTRIAGKMRHAGLSATEIAAALQAVNAARCDPPLPREEVEAIARSVGRYDAPADSATPSWPQPIDLRALAGKEPEPPQFIVRDWLPAGYATLFAGHGGVGKSAIALHLAVCIALGRPFFGIDTERRRVGYLSCEDREGVLHWRLAHIAAHLGIQLDELAGWLDVLDLVGHDSVLWDRDPRSGATVTSAFGYLAQRIEQSQTQVLCVDGVSDTYAGNENARPDVKRYVNALLSLLPEDGALLLIGHVNRPAAASPATSEGYSGSTAWHNSVRSRLYLYPEKSEDDDGEGRQRSGKLLLELQKSNLAGVTTTISFRFDEQARIFVGTPVGGDGGLVDGIRSRTEQSAILRAILASTAAGVAVPAAMQGPRTAYLVLSQRPEFPDSLRGGARVKTRRFIRHVEALRQIRFVTESSMRRSNRHAVAILEVTPEGCAECANS